MPLVPEPADRSRANRALTRCAAGTSQAEEHTAARATEDRRVSSAMRRDNTRFSLKRASQAKVGQHATEQDWTVSFHLADATVLAIMGQG